jgi:hypothetical protein
VLVLKIHCDYIHFNSKNQGLFIEMEEQREGKRSLSVKRRRGATPSPRVDEESFLTRVRQTEREESFLTPLRQTERVIPRPLIRSRARSVDEESFSTPVRQRERVV